LDTGSAPKALPEYGTVRAGGRRRGGFGHENLLWGGLSLSPCWGKTSKPPPPGGWALVSAHNFLLWITSRACCVMNARSRTSENTMIRLNVNGKVQSVDVDGDTPLLWVLRDVLGMTGTKFGCGKALCGACTVHLDGSPVRSCLTPVENVG